MKNLKPFKKGHSGNPKGKVKGTLSFAGTFKRLVRESKVDELALVNKALLRGAKRGYLGHVQEVRELTDGARTQKVRVDLYSDAFDEKKKKELEKLLIENKRV
jgi:hypothetical protein